MSKQGRQDYEVRVREKTGPDRWTKKSKFYKSRSPADARSRYKGKGEIMWVEKVKKEKLLGGVGEFFRLGDTLLKELRALPAQEQVKTRVRKRRDYFSRERAKINKGVI